MFAGAMLLDPVSGLIVSNELVRIEREMFEAGWAEAKTRLGCDPLPSELKRTPDQRRADALVEMARRSASLEGPATARPLFTLLLGSDALAHLSELSNGKVVPPVGGGSLAL